VSDLGGSQSSYTWVVTTELLAMTATVPLWGKLSDLYNKKLLIQLSLAMFVIGSLVAGFSQDIGTLIASRVVQGVGAGGLTALAQVVMAAMVSPRELGRYMGIFGAVFAAGTVAGPLIGGLMVDTSWLGWRWCFFLGVPFAVAAILLLGAVLANRVSSEISSHLGVLPGGGSSSAVPDLSLLPEPVANVIRDAYGVAASEIFLYCLPFAVLSVAVVFFIKQIPLKTQTGNERLAEETGVPVD
jgi:MFS family permease